MVCGQIDNEDHHFQFGSVGGFASERRHEKQQLGALWQGRIS
jgi:hypothetical protein